MREYIPHKELVERLKTIKEVLLENETAVTPDLIEAMDMVMDMMKPADKVMKDIDEIFKAMFEGGTNYGNDKKGRDTSSKYLIEIYV